MGGGSIETTIIGGGATRGGKVETGELGGSESVYLLLIV